jgi:hypothetical protein
MRSLSLLAVAFSLAACAEPELSVVEEEGPPRVPAELDEDRFRVCSAADPCVLFETLCTCAERGRQFAVAQSSLASVPDDVGSCLLAVNSHRSCTTPTGAACIDGRCRLVVALSTSEAEE